MKNTTIRHWEWSAIKRGFIAGLSYSELAKKYNRSRTQIAERGRHQGWADQRRALQVMREMAWKNASLRNLDAWTTVADEWVARLDVEKTRAKLIQAREAIAK